MKSVHVIISGGVQGVGYRAWLKREAEKKGVTGWVKNREDGTVEAVLQGEEEPVHEAVKCCQKGPMTALIENVQIEDRNYNKNLKKFEVVY